MAFGKPCRVVELAAADQNEIGDFIAAFKKQHSEAELDRCVTTIWVSRCLVDADGKRIILDADIQQIANQSSGRDIRRLFKAIAKLNGLQEVDDDSGNS
jgi:hypothetical protein